MTGLETGRWRRLYGKSRIPEQRARPPGENGFHGCARPAA